MEKSGLLKRAVLKGCKSLNAPYLRNGEIRFFLKRALLKRAVLKAWRNQVSLSAPYLRAPNPETRRIYGMEKSGFLKRAVLKGEGPPPTSMRYPKGAKPHQKMVRVRCSGMLLGRGGGVQLLKRAVLKEWRNRVSLNAPYLRGTTP